MKSQVRSQCSLRFRIQELHPYLQNPLAFGTGIPQVGIFNTVPVPVYTVPVSGTGPYRTVLVTVLYECDNHPWYINYKNYKNQYYCYNIVFKKKGGGGKEVYNAK